LRPACWSGTLNRSSQLAQTNLIIAGDLNRRGSGRLASAKRDLAHQMIDLLFLGAEFRKRLAVARLIPNCF
jgi:hypothetical protein